MRRRLVTAASRRSTAGAPGCASPRKRRRASLALSFASGVVLAACARGEPIVDPGAGGGSAGYGGYGGYGGSYIDTGTSEVGGYGGYGGAGIGGAGGGSTGTTSLSCGDGSVDPGEECDDGNTIDGDGCSSTCAIECAMTEHKNPVNHHCYAFFGAAMPEAMAEADCITWGGAPDLGHLVSIGDAGEQAYVGGILLGDIWTGAGDAVTDGTFVWTDGTPFNYQSFGLGKPDGGTVQNCVRMRTNGDWDDDPCTVPYDYVCERRGAGTF